MGFYLTHLPDGTELPRFLKMDFLIENVKGAKYIGTTPPQGFKILASIPKHAFTPIDPPKDFFQFINSESRKSDLVCIATDNTHDAACWIDIPQQLNMGTIYNSGQTPEGISGRPQQNSDKSTELGQRDLVLDERTTGILCQCILNIQLFLRFKQQKGEPNSNLFTVPDLYKYWGSENWGLDSITEAKLEAIVEILHENKILWQLQQSNGIFWGMNYLNYSAKE